MRSLTDSARSVSVPETVPLDIPMDEYILPGGQYSQLYLKKLCCVSKHIEFFLCGTYKHTITKFLKFESHYFSINLFQVEFTSTSKSMGELEGRWVRMKMI